MIDVLANIILDGGIVAILSLMIAAGYSCRLLLDEHNQKLPKDTTVD